MVFHFGVCSAAHSNMSTMTLSAGSAGKIQACCAMYSLRMSFWIVPCSCSIGHPLLLRGGHVEAEDDRRGAVDGHRGGDLVERNPVEERLHVRQRRDGHAALADLPLRARVVAVVPHQRREVEGHREAGLPAREQELVALVGVLGRAEAGELPHGPELAAVRRWGGCRGCRGTAPAECPGRAGPVRGRAGCTPDPRCGRTPR